MMKSVAAFCLFASFSLAAFANPPAAPAAPPGHPAGGTVDSSKAVAPLTKKGKVLSAIDTKSFTYIELQDGSKKLWIVAPTVTVKSGNTISYADAPLQAKYHSPSLNRDFTDIVFTTRAVIDK